MYQPNPNQNRTGYHSNIMSFSGPALFSVLIIMSITYFAATGPNHEQDLWVDHYTNGSTTLVHRVKHDRQIRQHYAPELGRLFAIRYEDADLRKPQGEDWSEGNIEGSGGTSLEGMDDADDGYVSKYDSCVQDKRWCELEVQRQALKERDLVNTIAGLKTSILRLSRDNVKPRTDAVRRPYSNVGLRGSGKMTKNRSAKMTGN